MTSKNFRLFMVSILIFAITFIIAIFWQTFGLTDKQTPFLAILLVIIFGLNIAGVIIGFGEIKTGERKAKIGLIGNSVFIVFMIMLTIYAIVGDF